MSAEAIYFRSPHDNRITIDATLASGEVRQLPDGRAAVAVQQTAGASGDVVKFETQGVFKMIKTTNTFVALAGGRAYWDHSANVVTFEKVNDRDFYLGRFAADATYAATEVYVNLNVDPKYDIDMKKDAFLSVPTGTKAAGAFGYPKQLGGCNVLELTATNEAQCIDMLSVDKFAIASNPIAEFIFRFDSAGSDSTVDFNIGLANGTSTTDADAVTEHLFLHIDGGSTNNNLQSKDGTTTVTSTDSTTDFTAGTAVANRVEVWMDARDPADVQVYIDGVLMLDSTVFALGAGTGPLGLLAHIEKTSGTATGRVTIDEMRVRYMQQ